MTPIDATVARAAEMFNFLPEELLQGGIERGRAITAAREWIVAQHPDMSDYALARAMNYSNRSVIWHMRRRIAKRKKATISRCESIAELS